uniref:long-chain-fatty-acid--CoA ligase n=1 Tax=Romanomermis culicivorax TaxID=13658 RepID=A0A915I6F4_ROMCU
LLSRNNCYEHSFSSIFEHKNPRIFPALWAEIKKAKQLNPGDINSPWRRTSHFDKLLEEEFPTYDTMDKLWRRAHQLFGNKACLGTREIVKIQPHMQDNGKLFEKFELAAYKWQSFDQVQELTEKFGSALFRFNIKPNDRILIISETRAEWMITALACFQYKVTIVTLYPTVNEAGVAHALNEAENQIVITSYDLASRILDVAPKCPLLKIVVYFPSKNLDSPPLDVERYAETLPKGFRILPYDQFLEFGAEKLIQPPSQPTKDDIAMVMYTSGTTGQPKGVVLSHGNLVAGNAGECHYVRGLGPNDIYVGYLPMAHVLEFMAEFGSLTHGACVGYGTPLTLTDKSSKIIKGTKGDLTILRPTLMAAVPVSFSHTLQNFRRFIFKRVRTILGGRIRLMLSGGAPLNSETERFMNICFCCPVSQGYGLTETAGAGAVCEIDDITTGRCGPPLPCVDLMLRPWTEGGYRLENKPFPQGEILFSGPNVCVSYFKNAQLDAQDFVTINGRTWFVTGDIGEVHGDGCLKVIDRKKDLIKMQHGEYVSLAKVESALLTNPLVDNVCVYGRPMSSYTVALVVPNENNLRNLAKKLNITSANFDELRSNKVVHNAVLRELQDHGKKNLLEKFERPEKIHLCKEVWTVDSGLLTDAMKLKRKPLEQFYKEILKQLYNGYSP